jgi:hypothetical protein
MTWCSRARRRASLSSSAAPCQTTSPRRFGRWWRLPGRRRSSTSRQTSWPCAGTSLRLPAATALDVTPRTLYRHHEQIRAHLQVRSWGPEARRATIVAVHQAAQVMDHPADLINVAIEELVRQRFELPAFSTLDTLATHVRAVVHRRLFGTVLGRLADRQRHELDALLETDQLGRSAFNALKRAPKQPPLSHLDDLVGHVRWLQELGDPADLLAGVACVLT